MSFFRGVHQISGITYHGRWEEGEGGRWWFSFFFLYLYLSLGGGEGIPKENIGKIFGIPMSGVHQFSGKVHYGRWEEGEDDFGFFFFLTRIPQEKCR